MAKGQKPGLILYHEDLHALEGMDGETFKTVILSLLSLSETGVDSNPGGMAGVAYAFMSRKVKEDNDSYQTTVEKRKAAVNARWGKHTPEQPEKPADVSEQIHVNTNEYMCMHVNTNDTQQQPQLQQQLQQKPQQEQKPQREQESPPNLDTTELIDTGADQEIGGGGLTAYLSGNLLPMSPGNYAALNDIMAQGISESLVRYAVDIASANGKRTWGYVQGILNAWIVGGVRTVGEAKAEHEARKRDGPPGKRMSAGEAFGALARKYAEEEQQHDETGDSSDFASHFLRLSSPQVGGL